MTKGCKMNSVSEKFVYSKKPKTTVKLGLFFNLFDLLLSVVTCNVLKIDCNLILPGVVNLCALLLAAYGYHAVCFYFKVETKHCKCFEIFFLNREMFSFKRKRHYMYVYIFCTTMKLIWTPVKVNWAETILSDFMIEKMVHAIWISTVMTMFDVLVVVYVVIGSFFLIE